MGLLRGVNLGKRQIGMPDLRRLFEGAGFDDVSTYLRSGNVLFSTEADKAALRGACEDLIAAEFGMDVPTLVLDRADLEEIVAACPYQREGAANHITVHVTFVDELPSAEALARIEEEALAPEAMTVGERAVYLHLPAGMGRAKLPTRLERATRGVTATTRNWRTVLALHDLLDES